MENRREMTNRIWHQFLTEQRSKQVAVSQILFLSCSNFIAAIEAEQSLNWKQAYSKNLREK